MLFINKVSQMLFSINFLHHYIYWHRSVKLYTIMKLTGVRNVKGGNGCRFHFFPESHTVPDWCLRLILKNQSEEFTNWFVFIFPPPVVQSIPPAWALRVATLPFTRLVCAVTAPCLSNRTADIMWQAFMFPCTGSNYARPFYRRPSALALPL